MNSTYYEGSQSNSYSLTKVFGWLFYAILLTAVTAFGIPYLLVAINMPWMHIIQFLLLD